MNLNIQIIVVMFLWAICFPLIVLGLPYAPHLSFAAMRGLLAGIVLLLLALIMKRPQPREAKTWAQLALIGFGATTLGFFGMFHASEFITPGVATVIASTQPMMAAMLAAVMLKEYLPWRGKAGLAFAFFGIILISLPSFSGSDSDSSLLGIFYIILAALGITISNVLIRKIAGRVDALSAMGWQLIFGSLFLMMIAAFTENISDVTWNSSFIFSLVGLALPGTALAYWMWCRVLAQAELNHANVFSFLVPIFGLVMGVLFFDESVGMLAAAGIGMIVLGISMVNVSNWDVA